MFAGELLDFDNEDVAAGIRLIARSPREEGQTAFPDLGTLLGAIKRQSGERQRVAREKKAAEEMKWREEDHRLHPENYISVAEIFDLVLKKRGMTP